MNAVMKSFKLRLQLRLKQTAKVKTSASETGGNSCIHENERSEGKPCNYA